VSVVEAINRFFSLVFLGMAAWTFWSSDDVTLGTAQMATAAAFLALAENRRPNAEGR
jgi:hypothetical protein